jgi:hypothetical protein
VSWSVLEELLSQAPATNTAAKILLVEPSVTSEN